MITKVTPTASTVHAVCRGVVPAIILILTLHGAAVGAQSEQKETLIVTSANPFNFIAALADPKAGGEVRLEAALAFPPEAKETDKFPAMIFIHGAGGPQPHHKRWLELIRAMGIVTVYADHFKPRGKSSAVGSHIQLTGAAMAVDALNMLAALSAHPRIDADRIGIMGASKGGGVTLYSAWTPLRQRIVGNRDFAAYIPLYPTCIYWDKKDFTLSPVMVMVGENDDWTGAEHCRKSVAEFRAAGFENIDIKVYEGAPHGFDSGVKSRKIERAYSVANCRFSIGPDGRDYASGIFMDTAENKRKGLGQCATRGVTYGGDDHAMTLAKADVRSFLKATLFR